MTLKLRKRSLFPASVSAVSPLVLTKDGVIYTFSIDIDQITASLDPRYLNKHLVIYTVAPSTASATDKSGADYVGDGVNDQVAVNAAVNAAKAINSYSKVIMLPGTYWFSAVADVSGGNGFVFDAEGTQVNGPGVQSGTLSALDTFKIQNSNSARFRFGSINTNSSGAAIHSFGGYIEADIKFQSLDGTARNGYGILIDSRVASGGAGQSVNWITGTHVQNFNIGIALLKDNGVGANIDTYRTMVDYIYNNNKGVYCNSTGGNAINANIWNINIDASHTAGDIGFQTNASYDVVNATIASVAGGSHNIVLDSGATDIILNLTPQPLVVAAGSIVDNSGSTTNMLNIQASIDAVTNGLNQLVKFDGSNGNQLERTGLTLGTIGANNTVAQFTALGVLSSSSTLPAGTKLPGTTTNDSASAGNVGEIVTAGIGNLFAAPTATVTVTIASPGVVTWAAHGIAGVAPVVFTTTGALPTGITAGTVYWTIPSTITTNTFQIATSVANALAGTAVNTSGTQSGTQTGTVGVPLTTGTPTNACAVSLTAGDWDISGTGFFQGAGTTTLNYLVSGESTTTGTFTGSAGSGGSAQTYAGATPFATLSVLPQQFGPQRVSLASTTTIYGIVQGGFGVSTLLGFAFLRARRVR